MMTMFLISDFKMRNLIHVLLAIAITTGLVGCGSRAPVYNVERHAMPAKAKALSTQEIGQRICEVLSRREWNCNQTTANTLVCHLKRRTHNAIVQIDYNQDYFSIHYIDTNNLRYECGTVHAKYNKWIKLMEKDILRSINQAN
ncbi:MAG TPA: hypothetical protein VMW10_08945 [Alphaproteobacteria bacterium]|nr:hypothetical protein [Alphaproteobacteria bacterium]